MHHLKCRETLTPSNGLDLDQTRKIIHKWHNLNIQAKQTSKITCSLANRFARNSLQSRLIWDLWAAGSLDLLQSKGLLPLRPSPSGVEWSPFPAQSSILNCFIQPNNMQAKISRKQVIMLSHPQGETDKLRRQVLISNSWIELRST